MMAGDDDDDDQPDLFSAKARRDEALARVLDNAGPTWSERALAEIDRLPPGRYTGEQIRLRVERLIGKPHHHNAWGAIIRTAKAHGYIVPTGQWEPMQTKRSHARPTPVYAR